MLFCRQHDFSPGVSGLGWVRAPHVLSWCHHCWVFCHPSFSCLESQSCSPCLLILSCLQAPKVSAGWRGRAVGGRWNKLFFGGLSGCSGRGVPNRHAHRQEQEWAQAGGGCPCPGPHQPSRLGMRGGTRLAPQQTPILVGLWLLPTALPPASSRWHQPLTRKPWERQRVP